MFGTSVCFLTMAAKRTDPFLLFFFQHIPEIFVYHTFQSQFDKLSLQLYSVMESCSSSKLKQQTLTSNPPQTLLLVLVHYYFAWVTCQ